MWAKAQSTERALLSQSLAYLPATAAAADCGAQPGRRHRADVRGGAPHDGPAAPGAAHCAHVARRLPHARALCKSAAGYGLLLVLGGANLQLVHPARTTPCAAAVTRAGRKKPANDGCPAAAPAPPVHSPRAHPNIRPAALVLLCRRYGPSSTSSPPWCACCSWCGQGWAWGCGCPHPCCATLCSSCPWTCT